MKTVALGPNPSSPTNLSVGLDLMPPRLDRMWYIAREDDLGALAKMMKSMSRAKLSFVLASNSTTVSSIESPEKFAMFLLASSFDAKD